MTTLPFKATPRKVGASIVVTIPYYLIENHLIIEGNEYDFNVEAEEK